MKRTIYIHVGAGKTGTSAIQSFLLLNQNRLMQSGLSVPAIGSEGGKAYLAHHRLSGAGRFADSDPFPMWREISRIDTSRVLVSSEIFHSRISNKDGIEFFEAVKEILASWEIRIVFYIRRQDQWLESAYEQWIKTGELRTGESIDQFADRYRKSLVQQVRSFCDIFGKDFVIVRPYQRSQLKNADIIEDFFDVIGLNIDQTFEWPVGNPNPSLPAELLEFKRLYNSVCNSRNEAQLINRDLKELAKLYSGKHNEKFTSRNSLSAAAKHDVLRAHAEGYEWIARELLSRINGVLFYGDNDEKSSDTDSDTNAPSVSAEPRLEEHIKILTFLVQKLYKRNAFLEERIRMLEGPGKPVKQ